MGFFKTYKDQVMSVATMKAGETVIQQMVSLLENIQKNQIITHENQLEIDQRLTRIEKKLGIQPK